MVKESLALTAQASLIGAAALYPQAAGEIFAQAEEGDFIDPSYRSLFQAARRLWLEGKPIDPVTLRDAAGRRYNDLLVHCIDMTASVTEWPAHLEILRRESRLHQLRQLSRRLAEAQDLEEAQAVMGQANQLFVNRQDRRVVTAYQGYEEFLRRQGENKRYLSWGIPKLDERLYADLGDFIVVGGRPSAGKTALALNLADHIAKTYKTAFFSLETSDQKLFDRYFAAKAGVDFSRVKRRALTPLDKQRLEDLRQAARESKLSVVNAGGMSVQDIQALTLAGRYQVIFVDYLQLVSGQGRNRTEEVARVSMALHTLARVHNVAVAALAQLSRSAGGDPRLDSLKESGQIEQDADAVLLLYRQEEDNRENQNRWLEMAKNKEGRLGRILLHFDGGTQTFTEIEAKRKLEDPYERQGFLQLSAGW